MQAIKHCARHPYILYYHPRCEKSWHLHTAKHRAAALASHLLELKERLLVQQLLALLAQPLLLLGAGAVVRLEG